MPRPPLRLSGGSLTVGVRNEGKIKGSTTLDSLQRIGQSGMLSIATFYCI